MNYAGINYSDSLNGEGNRLTVFVSGCNHKCVGCHNPETWDFNYGEKFNQKKIDELIKYFKENEKYLSGLSLSGGDPLAEDNWVVVYGFVKRFKSEFPNKTVNLWTGYLIEEILNDEKRSVLNYLDLLIDGKFIKELADKNLKLRGSSNQRIIDVKETLRLGNIVEAL